MVGRLGRSVSTTFGGVTPRSRTVLLLLLLAAATVMGQLGAMVSAMHLPGTRSASVVDLASPLTGPREGVEILATWDGWDSGNIRADRVTTDVVVTAWLAVDTLLFAPALFLLVRGAATARLAAVRRRYPDADAGATPATSALEEVLDLARSLAVAYLVFDVAENAVTLAAVATGTADTSFLPWVQATSAAKWAAIVLALPPVVTSFVRDGRSITGSVGRWWPTVATLRVQVVGSLAAAAVLLYLPGPVQAQLTDLVRDWSHHWERAVFAVAAVLVLAAVLWATGREALGRAAEGDRTSTPPQVLVVGAAGILLMLAGVVVLPRVPGLRAGALGVVLGATMVAWAALSFPHQVRRLPNTRRAVVERPGVLAVLTFLPPYALFLAWVPSIVTFGPWLGRVAVGLVAVALLVILWHLLHHATAPAALGWVTVAGALVAVAGFAVVAAARGSTDLASHVGAVAMVVVWLSSLVVVLWALDRLLQRPPSGTLAFAGLQRFPLLTFLAVLVVGTSTVTTSPGFHLVRVHGDDDQAGAPRTAFTVAEAFEWWQGEAPANDTWQPLLLVASSGGGGRAAYWTILAMDCLFGDDPVLSRAVACDGGALDRTSTFVASGISGGSVGMAMFSAAGGDLDPDAVFGDGFVEPIIANLLGTDAPNALVHSRDWRDRAGALEDAWEDAIPGMAEPFDLPVTAGEAWDPLLLLNSAAVEDGCRVNVSALSLAVNRRSDDGVPAGLRGSCQSLRQFELARPANTQAGPLPAARDLRDLLCDDESIHVSTAALLSARFPYVSPSGALAFCSDPERFTFMVDGGLVDSSAASPLEAVLDTVMPLVRSRNAGRADGVPCIQPVVLQLDNGYDDVTPSGPPGRPKELVAPATGKAIAGNAAASTARQSLAETASTLVEDAGCGADEVPRLPTWVHVSPQAHPGIQAPLGWSLSTPAREDLRNELQAPRNQCALLVVRQWLSGTIGGEACVGGTVRREREPGGPPGEVVDGAVVDAPGVHRDCGPGVDCGILRTDAMGNYLLMAPGRAADIAASLTVAGGSRQCVVPDPDAFLVRCDFTVSGDPPSPLEPPDALPARAVVAAIAVAALLAIAERRDRVKRDREEAAARRPAGA
jgi:hypothetical protein